MSRSYILIMSNSIQGLLENLFENKYKSKNSRVVLKVSILSYLFLFESHAMNKEGKGILTSI